jgi:hemerythrin-like domain-containing protein
VTNEPYADVSEMYMAHTMFRREFGLLPGLIDGVSAADIGRARVIAQHFSLIQTVLLHHHHAEDQALWPRLEQRAGRPGEVVVAAMESQHGEIDKIITDLRDGLETWQETADRPQGAALAESARHLVRVLAEHLTTEEEQALPLIARFITASEWGEMVATAAKAVPAEEIPLIFGLMTYEGAPEAVAASIAQMPPEVQPVMSELAPEAFARHSELVHGTATPAKSSARS